MRVGVSRRARTPTPPARKWPRPVDDERSEENTWDDLLSQIGCYMEVLFVLNSRRDKEVWQYVVGVAAQLEYLAVAVLWVAAGKPAAFEEFEGDLTLGRAANRIESKGLLDSTTVQTLRAASRLRNSVAHRGAVYGVTVPGPRDRGMYKGGHVFTDLGTLRLLADDTGAAVEAMGAWLRQREQTVQ